MSNIFITRCNDTYMVIIKGSQCTWAMSIDGWLESLIRGKWYGL